MSTWDSFTACVVTNRRNKRPKSGYPTFHYINGRTLYRKRVEKIYFVNRNIRNNQKRWYSFTQIQQCVEFDRRLCRTKMSPGRKAHTQIDYSGFESIEGLIKFYPKGFFCIDFSCSSNQRLCPVRIDAPDAFFVGVGQCTPGHPTAESHLIQKSWPRFQSSDYIAKTVPISQLG